MAATPLIDFESLDLSRTVVDREALDEHLKQRGSFSLLDGVLYESPEEGLIVGYKDLAATDFWAADHIPGRPMFPGVLQIEAAAQLCGYDYSAHRLNHDLAGKFVGFGGVEHARFRGLVEPGNRFLVAASLLKHSSRMFRYAAQAFVERKMVFEAEIIGVLV